MRRNLLLWVLLISVFSGCSHVQKKPLPSPTSTNVVQKIPVLEQTPTFASVDSENKFSSASKMEASPTSPATVSPLRPSDITNALAVVAWFKKVLARKRFDSLSVVMVKDIGFFAKEGYEPTFPPSQAIEKIRNAFSESGQCLGYSEGGFGVGYGLEIIVGGAQWGNECRECKYGAFWFVRDDEGRLFLEGVEYIWNLQEEKELAIGRSNDHRWHTCEDVHPEVLKCGKALPSRLVVGKYAYVNLTPPLPNRVRAGVGKHYSVIGRIQPGQVVKVIDGPVCADGWAWWKIKTEDGGVIGWTAEGDDHDYWLVSCPGTSKCSP